MNENDVFEEVLKIQKSIEETDEEFILTTVLTWCDEVFQRRISKRELNQALTEYYGHEMQIVCEAVMSMVNRYGCVDEFREAYSIAQRHIINRIET